MIIIDKKSKQIKNLLILKAKKF